MPEVTLVSCPKPWDREHIAIIQRNALHSWTLLDPRPTIVLVGKEVGTAEAARQFGAIHAPDVRCSAQGTPLANATFAEAEKVATGGVILYTNADIILTQSVLRAIDIVAEKLNQFLILGRRWDLRVTSELDFSPQDVAELNTLLKTQGHLHSPSGMDWMAFPKGQYLDLKDLVLGRAAWDGAFLSLTLHRRIPVVDASTYVTVIHQEHDYAHLPGDWQEAWMGPEAEQNRKLSEPLPYIIDMFYATWALEGTGNLLKKTHPPPLPDRSVNDPGQWVLKQAQTQAPRPPVAVPPPPMPILRRPNQVSSVRSRDVVIFTCPKPFGGHIEIIQRNAIQSWTMLNPRPEIVLCGEGKIIKEVADNFLAQAICDIKYSDGGAPLVNSVFPAVVRQESGKVFIWANADLIFTQSVMDTAATLLSWLEDFLAVGRRWNLSITTPIQFTRGTWWRDLRRQVTTSGQLHAPDGLDYFIFTRGFWDDVSKLPPLAIGRAAVDGALLSLALATSKPVVDITEVAFVVHQNHDYSHLRGGKNEVWSGADAERNRRLVPSWPRTVAHCTYMLTSGGLIKKG